MKVLQINAVNGLSSTGRIVQELAFGLEARGIECSIAYTYGTVPERGYVIGTKFERLIHALGSRIVGKQGYFSKRGTRGLIRFIETESPDVVHLHNLHGNYVNLPMLLGHLARMDIPTVLTLHDCWFYTGKCCHYTSDACNRWEAGCGSCPRLCKDNRSWMIDASASMWAEKKSLFEAIPRLAVVGVSDWITSEARRSYLSCASDIRRIYNWVDMEVFKPSRPSEAGMRCGFGDEGFVILGVASCWSPAKGLDDFAHLARMIENGALDLEPHGTPASRPARPRIVLLGAVKDTASLPACISLVGPTSD
ncbi:group 1 glycosyl transferase, partial [bacterium]|nr:group 1 glycosyl transferase [bacterium]